MPDIIDYELADAIVLDTPERLKAVGDPLRMLILDLVLERAMSVSELAHRVGKAKGTVAHHVDLLVGAGLLAVVRTRKVRAMEERFYGRAARTIVFPSTDDARAELPLLAQAAAEADFALIGSQDVPSGFTLRHARIPAERAEEWNRRLHDLALEFSREPRDGDIEFAVMIGLFPTTRRVTPKPRGVPKTRPVEPRT